MAGRTRPSSPSVIAMTEHVDPTTGSTCWSMPFGGEDDRPRAGVVAIRGGQLAVPEGDAQPASVALTNDRFAAGFGDEFEAIERAQADGHAVRIENGRLVSGESLKDAEDAPTVELTNDRFAALRAAELREFKALVVSGAAERYINTLQSTSDMPDYFPQDPGGIYLHTKPTRLGDELHVVIKHEHSSGLWRAHLWTFVKNEGGQLRVADLNRWVGGTAGPGLNAHTAHLYPGRGGEGGVLCLSARLFGGIDSLSGCVVRVCQWATGMGEVVRGRPFPYRQ